MAAKPGAGSAAPKPHPYLRSSVFSFSKVSLSTSAAADSPAAALRAARAAQRPPASTSPYEHLALFVLFLLMFVMRIAAAWHYRIDSDETQHMHVVWGWTRGLLQYRDIFDNHTPLFQMLMAPYMKLFPERVHTILWLRAAMIPFFAVSLWATYRIGASLFSPRVGRWAAVFTGFMPGFFLCSAEFRTDDLWTMFWLLSIAVLIGGKLNARRSFLSSLLFGATLAASMKTMLLLSCVAGAAVAVAIFQLCLRHRFDLRQGGLNLLAGLGGFVIVPGLVVGYFAARGSWASMFYCVWKHNLIMRSSATGAQGWFLPICAVLLALSALYFFKSKAANRGSRAFIFLIASIYIVALFTLWPLLEREHYLPFFPLLILCLSEPLLRLGNRIAGWFPAHASLSATLLFPCMLAVFEAHECYSVGRLGRDHTKGDLQLVRAVLALTGPNQTVIDKKGETVFRPRTFFYVLEPIVRTAIRTGLINDDTIDRAIATGTRVAIGDIRSRDIPDNVKAFLFENYLNTGTVRILGKRLTPATTPGQPEKFTIRVPETYAVIDATTGKPLKSGTLDGTPYTAPQALAPGEHTFTPSPATDASAPPTTVAVMLADAVNLGYKPLPPETPPPIPNHNKQDHGASKFQRGLSKLVQ